MDNIDFLLEIGVEEIPAGYISNAIDKIRNFFVEKLTESQLKYDNLQIYTTPRRFAVKITCLQSKQNDQVIEKIGPSVQVSYTETGELSKAASGFLRGSGAARDDIYTISTPKGEKIAVKFEKKGLGSKEILTDLIPEILDKIHFPKTMKWKNRELTFARPIRWLLILLGDKTIKLEHKTLRSGNFSYGNRFLSLDRKIKINDINEYEQILESVFVIPDRKKRKEIIESKINNLFKDSSLNIVSDDQLLEIVTDLVEYPEPVIAEFNENYLTLPEKIITSTLSQHQKYFSVADEKGKIINKFVFVSNGNPEFNDLIRLGNEKVIRARLDDAEFFFNEDVKIPFDRFVPKLEEVTFQEKLGNILEKTDRIIKNTEYLCNLLKLPDFVKNKSLRTAKLCKADLVTLMLGEKEFTKLQGYIGWKYAERSGEKYPIPEAIFEHYLPRWQKDRLPDSMQGSVVAIADKIDTLCGIIGVGMIPTGSKDPFALRRAANGIVQIIAAKKFNISINDLIDNAFSSLTSKLEKNNNNIEIVKDFMKQRINWFLQEKGIDYDVIDSVMHIDHNYIPTLWNRAWALQNLKNSNEFINLVAGFKRVSNIIDDKKGSCSFNSELLKENAEKSLFDEYRILKEKISEFLEEKDYSKVLELLIKFGKSIDRLFDEVLVNVENNEIRINRYGLLLLIKKLFLKVADLSKIVIDGN